MAASGAGKSYYIYQKIIRNPSKSEEAISGISTRAVYDADTERTVRMHPRKRNFKYCDLKFERLAFRVLEETGYLCEDVLEETGKSLVIRKDGTKS